MLIRTDKKERKPDCKKCKNTAGLQFLGVFHLPVVRRLEKQIHINRIALRYVIGYLGGLLTKALQPLL